jgi:RimJ/RimL family protein N-acetyltransferase
MAADLRIPTLTTERLRVRELTLGDEPPLGRSAEWLRWTVLCYAQYAELLQPPYGERAVTLDGEVIGLVGLVPSLVPTDAGVRPEVGLYWEIAEPHRGRGYATEAARALAEEALRRLRLARVIATTTHDNEPSIAVMRRLGMRVAQGGAAWCQVCGVLAGSRAR